jgi:kanosamine 6-kinase
MTPANSLGVDFGGTKVAFRAGPPGPAAEGFFRWPSPARLADDINAFDAFWAEFRGGCGPIMSVGVAMPATVNRAGHIAAWPSRPGWVGVDLREFLASRFPGATVSWADDGQLAALAEGREAGCPDLAYLGVGTGVGGGLLLRGLPYPGLARGSELGHMIIDRGGPPCSCGRRGCVQAVASGPATLGRAARLRGGAVTTAELRDACAAGLRWGTGAIRETAAALAAAVVNVTELLGPPLIRIGGGFAHELTCLVPEVIAEAARLDRPAHPHARIEPAALGGLSSLAGALLLAQQPSLADGR